MEGSITREETATLQSLILSMNDDELSLLLARSWEEFGMVSDADRGHIRRAFARIRRHTRRNHAIGIAKKVARVAAVMLLPIMGAVAMYLYDKPTELRCAVSDMMVETAAGNMTDMTLPDGTRVKLNASSRLSYGNDFGTGYRNVQLNGEAFFKVAPNKQVPFIVRTKYFDVEAIGTSFDIYAYENDDYAEATLLTGKVKIQTRATPIQTVYLNPNEKIIYDSDSELLTMRRSDDGTEKEWMHGGLAFHSAKMRDVFAKIERRYGVKIHAERFTKGDDRFTGYFDAERVEETLEILRKSYGFSYTKRGNDVYIDP